jgi:hypothetical protein
MSAQPADPQSQKYDRIQNAPPNTPCGVIDPFAGSCNGLYWILRHVRNAKGLGFEIENTIFEMTNRNIPSLDRQIELIRGDYKSLLDTHRFPSDHFVVAFLSPPWGDALQETTGLDLRRTKLPIADIVEEFERVYPRNPILYVTRSINISSRGRWPISRRGSSGPISGSTTSMSRG